jgi:hypothetical protein
MERSERRYAMPKMQIRIRIEEAADLEVVQSFANEQPDLQVEATTGAPSGGIESQIEPVTAVLIAAGAAAVAKFVMDWWEKRRGGLVVDMRPDAKDQIYRDRDVPYGFVLVFPADGGQVKIETRDTPKDATQQLLEAVISGAYNTVTDLTTAVREALPKATIEEAPATRAT